MPERRACDSRRRTACCRRSSRWARSAESVMALGNPDGTWRGSTGRPHATPIWPCPQQEGAQPDKQDGNSPDYGMNQEECGIVIPCRIPAASDGTWQLPGYRGSASPLGHTVCMWALSVLPPAGTGAGQGPTRPDPGRDRPGGPDKWRTGTGSGPGHPTELQGAHALPPQAAVLQSRRVSRLSGEHDILVYLQVSVVPGKVVISGPSPEYRFS